MTEHRTTPPLMTQEQLIEALSVANIPTLLMLLVQLTGDESWLEEPFRPTMPKGLDDNDSGGLPEAVQERVREGARLAILAWMEGKPVALEDPDASLIVRMLSVATGEPVAPDYGPMVKADIAQVLTPVLPTQDQVPPTHGVNAIIIGAGVSGICAAVRLAQAGIPYTILERNDEVGGVWSENHYPAAAVDTPSHLYSYSFAPGDWPRWFGSRDHIHAYLQDVARQFNVLPHIRFGTQVVRAVYDDDAKGWVVETAGVDGPQVLRARLVISAVGAFNRPVVPPLPGLSEFEGQTFHTARWPSDLDLSGKRVAVLGNGASAMQVVPAIAPDVAELTVFQMEPHWIAPFPKFKVMVPDSIRLLMRAVPLYHAWNRARLSWAFNDKLHATLRVDPAWPHPERSTNAGNDRLREALTAYLEAELGERTDLVADLLPTYPPLGKRLLLDNGWYRTMRRDNVTLVSDLVAEVRPHSVLTRSGTEIEADVLIFATGFDAVSFLSTLELVGRSGKPLAQVWGRDDAMAYLGLAVPTSPTSSCCTAPTLRRGMAAA